MGRMGNFNANDLKKFQKELEKLNKHTDAFLQACTKELAARLLEKVKKRTPVGDYSGDSYTCKTGQVHKGHRVKGKVGGWLRRDWSVGEIRNEGGVYKIDLINSKEYAPYVEYGHRTPDHKGWVPGHFMMTMTEKELEKENQKVLEKKLEKFLRSALH